MEKTKFEFWRVSNINKVADTASEETIRNKYEIAKSYRAEVIDVSTNFSSSYKI